MLRGKKPQQNIEKIMRNNSSQYLIKGSQTVYGKAFHFRNQSCCWFKFNLKKILWGKLKRKLLDPVPGIITWRSAHLWQIKKKSCGQRNGNGKQSKNVNERWTQKKGMDSNQVEKEKLLLFVDVPMWPIAIVNLRR